jgi:hypothetical protein
MTRDLDSRDPWLLRVSEYTDGELSLPERGAFEQHLRACGECAAAVEAVREVARRAKTLDSAIAPPRDLWPGIARRLTPRRAGRRRLAWPSPLRPAWLRPALAAVVLVAVACASIVWLLQAPPRLPVRRAAAPHPSAGPPPSTEAVGPAATEHDREYEKRVAALEREAQSRLSADPHLVEVLEENVATLDAAISTYREALAQQPGDEYLRSRLDDAKRRKLAVLQDAVSMAAEGGN